MKRAKKKEVTYVPARSKSTFWWILYIVEAVFLFVTCIFDGAWTKIAYEAMCFVLLSTAAVQSFTVSAGKTERIRAVLVFGINLFLLAYFFFFGNRYWLFSCVTCEFCLAVFSIAIWLVAERAEKETPSGRCVMIAITVMLLFPMVLFTQIDVIKYTFALWLLLPAGGIGVVFAGLMLGKFRAFFLSVLGQMSEVIAFVLLGVGAVYLFLFVGTMSVNYSFDKTPLVVGKYEVMEKHVSGGARSVTSYTLKVEIEGDERSIGVSRSEYLDIKEGDFIEVGYHGGALGIAYYQYIPAE